MRNKVLTLAAAIVAGGVMGSSPAQAATIFGLTDENDLVSFDSAAPSILLSAGPILGLGGQDLIGIDFRPANGQLYGVGNFGGIFQINTTSGVATLVSTVSVPLSGARYGVDFNPVPDRLRLTSDGDQNLRVNVTTGAAIVDGSINPSSANVVASAYTNSFAGATTTTLYDLDSVTNQLLIQSPPNSGTVTPQGGPLGVNITSVNGFDILFSDGEDGPNTAYAALQSTTSSVSQLYRINLVSGTALLVDTIGGGDVFDGIAAVPIPEPTAFALLGLSATGLLARRRRQH